MKMVIAIVQNEDANLLVEALMENHFSVTKLATTGGFLRVGNTTLLIGVEDDQVEKVIDLVRQVAKCREQIITTTTPSADVYKRQTPVSPKVHNYKSARFFHLLFKVIFI